jgi:hypothetical protein
MRNISKNSFIEALEARKDDVYVRILQDVSLDGQSFTGL